MVVVVIFQSKEWLFTLQMNGSVRSIAFTNDGQEMWSFGGKFRQSNTDPISFKVILCASKHICSIVRYCFRSFKQL